MRSPPASSRSDRTPRPARIALPPHDRQRGPASLSPQLSLAKLIPSKTPEQEAADDAADAQRPVAIPFTATPADVKARLIRRHPKACSATSDATLAETAALYARIGLAM